MTYHDMICTHIYNAQGIYSDLVLRIQPTSSNSQIPEGTAFKLHRIIVMRSPYLASLLSEAELCGDEYGMPLDMTIPMNDPNMAPEGISVALGHLNASFSRASLISGNLVSPRHRSILLRSVLASAYLMYLTELAHYATDLIKSDISRSTIIDYCQFANQPEWGGNYGTWSQDIRDCIFSYLCRGVVREISEKLLQFGAIVQEKHIVNLLCYFLTYHFEWLKKVVESKAFEVPSDVERYHVAKEIIQVRSAARGLQSSLVAGEENVLISFGTHKTESSGVTIHRKASKIVDGIHPSTPNGYGISGWSFGGSERKVWKAQRP
ncbi:hypothetical protein HK096_008228 [Nowakowskiella sp. JEL0078]|nr:hypothetical protein HK096_008228 [Nowakowskiella sp. JEL0078]